MGTGGVPESYLSDVLSEDMAMNRFDDLLAAAQANRLDTKLSPVPAGRVDQLSRTYPGLPDDYTEFLREIGFGSFGNSGYSIYDGLVLPDEVFDPTTAEDLGDPLIFGDDFQGYNGAFLPQEGWTVVEIDSATLTVTPVAKSFEEFVRRKVGELIA